MGSFNDAHMEKAPLNKITTQKKSINIGIWLVGTSNQIFIQGS